MIGEAPVPCQVERLAPIPLWKAKWHCKTLWIFMAGITGQSPAEGWGAFDPGLDPGAECAKGAVRLRGPSPWSGEGPERPTERSAWLRQRNAKDPKGQPSVPPGSASGTRKRRPLPVQETKPFPHVPPAPPKEGPFDRGIWGWVLSVARTPAVRVDFEPSRRPQGLRRVEDKRRLSSNEPPEPRRTEGFTLEVHPWPTI